MAIEKEIQYSGSVRTSTLNGNIQFDEGAGEIIIRDGSTVRTRINTEGFTFSEPSGTRRIRIGSNPADPDDVIEAISKQGVDVIDELEA